MERKEEEEEVESLINLVLNDKIGVKEDIYIKTTQWQSGLTFHTHNLGHKTEIITSKNIMKPIYIKTTQ